MSSRILKLFLMASFGYSSTTLAEPVSTQFSRVERIQKLRQMILTIRSVSDSEVALLNEHVKDTLKVCRAQLPGLKLSCFLEAAEAYCRREKDADAIERCRQLNDVMLIKESSQKLFVSHRERYEIMRSAKAHYRDALNRLFEQRLGALAFEFETYPFVDCPGEVRDSTVCTALRIEDFCRKPLHSKPLSWHSCSAALVWFIGRNSRPESEPKRPLAQVKSSQ